MAKQSEELVVWITGGGSGIGRALALEMAGHGHRVIVSGRRENRLLEVKQAIEEKGGVADTMVVDVTQEEQTQAVANQIVEKYGRLDICVANAGFSVYGTFDRTSADEWRRQMDVNFFGAIWTVQAALPHLKKTEGRLVVISSVAGKLAVARTSAYCASKFALVGLCNALYQELAGTGVSVTNILPGLIETEIINVGNDGQYREVKDKRPKQLMWPADRAAATIAKAIYRRKREAVITKHGKFAAFLGQHLAGPTYWALSRKGSDGIY